MKDYLNNTERLTIISFLKVVEQSEGLINSRLLSKDEIANIKRGCTYITKAILSVLKRLNKDAVNAFNKSIKNTKVFVSSNSDIEVYSKRKSAEIDAAYEENKEYFKLVELTMFYSCQDCKRKCDECEIYKEFEEQCIPEFDGMKQLDNCKYAYSGSEVNEALRGNNKSSTSDRKIGTKRKVQG